MFITMSMSTSSGKPRKTARMSSSSGKRRKVTIAILKHSFLQSQQRLADLKSFPEVPGPQPLPAKSYKWNWTKWNNKAINLKRKLTDFQDDHREDIVQKNTVAFTRAEKPLRGNKDVCADAWRLVFKFFILPHQPTTWQKVKEFVRVLSPLQTVCKVFRSTVLSSAHVLAPVMRKFELPHDPLFFSKLLALPKVPVPAAVLDVVSEAAKKLFSLHKEEPRTLAQVQAQEVALSVTLAGIQRHHKRFLGHLHLNNEYSRETLHLPAGLHALQSVKYLAWEALAFHKSFESFQALFEEERKQRWARAKQSLRLDLEDEDYCIVGGVDTLDIWARDDLSTVTVAEIIADLRLRYLGDVVSDFVLLMDELSSWNDNTEHLQTLICAGSAVGHAGIIRLLFRVDSTLEFSDSSTIWSTLPSFNKPVDEWRDEANLADLVTTMSTLGHLPESPRPTDPSYSPTSPSYSPSSPSSPSNNPSEVGSASNPFLL